MFGSEAGAFDGVPSGTVVAGRYRVHERIARGGLSVIYRVEHVRTGEAFAMKVLGAHVASDPQALQRFKHEIRASSRIRSENVVLVTDADLAPELGGAPFMVMELLRGSDLETHANRVGKMSPEAVVEILSATASVLHQAHLVGIVHRDLKPENVFLHERADGTKVVKVLDFGISKFLSAEVGASGIGATSSGAILGTPLYMAPEQAHGQNDAITPATDVWALGLIALRLLAGEHYWGTPTMPELMFKITAAPMTPPSERWPDVSMLTSDLDAWFLRSCEREPTKRWQSVDEQLRAFALALGVGQAAHATTALARTPTVARTNRWRRAVLATAALSTVATMAAWRLRAPTPSPPVMTASSSVNPAPPPSLAPSPEPTVASTPSASPSASSASVHPPRAAPRPVAVTLSATPSSASSPTACRETEVLSLGHCCPVGHVWQSDRCARPIATSF